MESKMKKIAALLAIALIATFASGCAGKVPIKITNDLGAWDIHEIYISPSAEEDWGESISAEILEPGQEFTSMVIAGDFDILVVDEDGDEYKRYDVTIGTAGYNWSVELSDIN